MKQIDFFLFNLEESIISEILDEVTVKFSPASFREISSTEWFLNNIVAASIIVGVGL